MEQAIRSLCLKGGGELVFKPFVSLEHFPQFHLTRVFLKGESVWVEHNLWEFYSNSRLLDFRPSVQEDIINAILWDEKLRLVDRNLF